ncbi:hypothetical protein [Kitasatospora sp. NPDC101183]|uniref:hypothetical protein n=1 Tax=Kitasatospora sp. NPDC101183 TaxID=3364100 RepID=UPI0038196D2F
MYSYDVAAAPGRSAAAPRSIPGMRPSYDTEHSYVTPPAASPTPIYDELYSEYRRLFRALPGDRTGEEDLSFTSFSFRDGHHRDHRPYATAVTTAAAPQPQAFHTYAGHLPGLPQFMPQQQAHPHQQAHQTHQAQHPQPAPVPAPQATGQGWVATGYLGAVQPPAPPAPAPVLGTATGLAAAPPTRGGRHRQMLSLPPGRSPEHP